MSNLVVIQDRRNATIFGRKTQFKITLDTSSQELKIAILDRVDGQLFTMRRAGDVVEGQVDPAIEVQVPVQVLPNNYHALVRFTLYVHKYGRMESSKLLTLVDESEEEVKEELTLESLGL